MKAKTKQKRYKKVNDYSKRAERLRPGVKLTDDHITPDLTEFDGKPIRFALGYPYVMIDGKVAKLHIYMARLYWKKKYGTELPSGSVVHHMDEDKSNYSPDNLMVFPDNSSHIAYHGNRTDMMTTYRVMKGIETLLQCRLDLYSNQLGKTITKEVRKDLCARPIDIPEVVAVTGIDFRKIEYVMQYYTEGIFRVCNCNGVFVKETRLFPLFFLWWTYNYEFDGYRDGGARVRQPLHTEWLEVKKRYKNCK